MKNPLYWGGSAFNGYENRKWKGIVQVKPKGGENYPLLIRVLDSKVEIFKDN